MILIQDRPPCAITAMVDGSDAGIAVLYVECANTLAQMLETLHLWSLKRGRVVSTFMS